MNLHLDFETRSAVDLKKCGVYRYAEDETTSILCAAYAIDDGPILCWTPGQRGLPEAIADADTITAHNAQFERIILRDVGQRYGLSPQPIEKFRCTMVQAYALGLPGALKDAAAAVGLDVRKDMAGRRLMLAMCKPRAPREGEAPGLYWRESPEDMARLRGYCCNDVEVERALGKRLLPLSGAELWLWFLDQRINDRGVYVDTALAEAAKKIVGDTVDRLDLEMREASGGAVTGVTDLTNLVGFCKARGMPDVDSLAKDRLQALLARGDLPDDVRRCLEIRAEGARASVSKIDALLQGRSRDGRARGFLQFHAAGTGRWAGRRFQPQNLKRPENKKAVERAIKTIRTGNADLVELAHGPALSVVGDTIRGMVAAAPGNELTAADYSNIEGRMLAWLGNERWKLEAFREFDCGEGPDLYRLAYGRSFGKRPEDVTEDERQIGKVMELALGYQGGPGAFLVMAKGYGLQVGKFWPLIARNAPRVSEKAEESYAFRGRASGVARETWCAAETLKLLWRAAHPAIVQFWADIEKAAILAVENPGQRVTCGKLIFRKVGSWLFMRLPSGRPMAYPYPEVREVPYFESTKRALTYKTVPDSLKPQKIIPEPDGSVNMKWARISTYGGMLAENATQAAARDVLAAGMTMLDDAGWGLVLHVHDEPVSENRIGFSDEAEYRRLMTDLPAWAHGLPVAAGSFRAERYRK